jgi:Flavodoxin
MRAAVVYESMFGGTRALAEAVAQGLSSDEPVRVFRAADADPELVTDLDLLVVGAPTHVHGLPRASSRRSAQDAVTTSEGRLRLEPGADTATGVREWLEGLGPLRTCAPVFDTRAKGPGWLTGRASKRIARALRRRGASIVVAPESFLTERNALVAGEVERARAWGASVAGRLA